MPDDKNVYIDPPSLEIPAPFVNKFQVLVAGGNVRIAFAEGFQGQPSNYRSAVAMSIADARALAIAIIESLPTSRLADVLSGKSSSQDVATALGLGLINNSPPKSR